MWQVHLLYLCYRTEKILPLSVLNGIREFQRAHKLFLKECFERECLAYISFLKPSLEHTNGLAGQEEKSPVPNPSPRAPQVGHLDGLG